MTNKTNLTFEKLSRKLEILLQNKNSTNKEIAKSIKKDTKDIFETLRLNKSPKTLFKNIVSIVIKVTYVLTDFILGLVSNILILLYKLLSINLDEAIMKAKIIEIG